MFTLLLTRLVLLALPFAVYFAWRRVARRSGREMGSTPWAWLVAAGLVLVGLSLMLSVVFHGDNRTQIYVPAEAQPGGRVTGGDYRDAPRPVPSPQSPNTSP